MASSVPDLYLKSVLISFRFESKFFCFFFIYFFLESFLYLHALRIDVYRFHREIHADRIPVALDEVARFEALHDTRLAGSAVANEDHLEQEVECVVRRNRHQCGWVAGGHISLIVWSAEIGPDCGSAAQILLIYREFRVF